ncbi:hypothetical protein, partial [Microseira wollei]|uniref:hypothetical protein n=1 Tax=Microseira wollei TaxID=467598 RepID=UPI001CFF013D
MPVKPVKDRCRGTASISVAIHEKVFYCRAPTTKGYSTASISVAIHEKVFYCRAPTTNFNHLDATGNDINNPSRGTASIHIAINEKVFYRRAPTTKGYDTASISVAIHEKVFYCRAPTTNFNHLDATGNDI